MSLKNLFSNTRGEAASLILIVSMIVATLGIITGSKVVEQQIRTTTNAQSTLGVTLYPNTMNFPIPEGKSAAFRVEVWGTRAARASKIIITVGGYTYPYNVLIEGHTTRYETVAPFLYNASTGIYAINVPLMGVSGAGNTYGKIEVQVDTNDGGPSANVSGQYLVTAAPTFTPVPPTATPIPPTATPIPPTATNTPVPPTPTNTPVPKIFTLNGSVKYATGQGTSGIAIKLLKYTPTSQRNQVAQTTTDANGNYQFANVSEGTYDVEPVSTATQSISPTVITIPLNASPFTVTAPTFTSSGSPPATNTPIPPPATNTPVPPATATPSSPRNGVWEFTMNCANGSYSYTRSTKGQYIGPGYCVDIWINDGTVYSGCGTWPGSQSFSGPYNQLYFAPNVYTLRGKVWNADRTQLLVDESLIKSCVEPTSPPATNTPAPVKRADIFIQSTTTSFNTQGVMTLKTVIKNAGEAAVNLVGSHTMKIEIAKDAASPQCNVDVPVNIGGLATGATINVTTQVYSKCSTFTPQPGTTYLLTLTLDPNNIIKETDETNNTKTLSFTQPNSSITNSPVPPVATNTPKATKTPTKSPTPPATTNPPATNTPKPPTVPPTVPPTLPPATTSTPSPTTTDVNMDITIINPQPNYMIWGTAQEVGASNKISAIKCNIGDSTKPLITIKCPQLKRGKSYEFIALAKAKLPNAQTIQSDKNTYLIPGTSTITPQSQKKTLTLPGNTQPPTNTPPAQATATPTATTTPNSDFNLQVIQPVANSQHTLPLQLTYRGEITGAASYTASYIDLKIYKYPITTNIPLIQARNSTLTNTSGTISFEGILSGTAVNTTGEYVLQVIPYGGTGTIIGNPKEIRFQVADAPAPPTATPTNTPVPGTPTPTPLRAICQDLLVSGDSAQKYDVIFLPSGYSDYNTFEADAKEAVSYYRNAVPDRLNAKYNYKIFTNLEKGYDVVTCRSTTNNSTYPCWSTFLAKDAMRNCNGDAYVIIAYTPKPSEDATKATQALNQFGGVKAVTLGKNRGEMLVLRYDLSQLTNIVSGSIVGGGGNSVSSLLRSVWENVLQKFR